ncbi:MAG: glycosyltransferase family 4 protein [Candidatus Methylarchaceae archaeon HK01M]|nr:glycosyltransferase family 4 protein [Candidatus Methylarchaceae archaeon HK01M]
MKVLMLSWEYPPRIVGGLARHVYWLSQELGNMGVEVTMVSLDHPSAPMSEVEGRTKIVRSLSYRFPSPDFISWVYQFNYWMLEKILTNLKNDYDIIHVHDWLTAPAGITLKYIFRRPLVVTIHSTEFGRRMGIHNDFQRHIYETEWEEMFEAWKVVVCSEYMKREVISAFDVPLDKLWVIPNGVNPVSLDEKMSLVEARSRFAEPWEHIILYVGRMVFEKGTHIFVEAARQLLSRRWDAKFVLVGEGPLRANLTNIVENLGLSSKFYFTGFLPDEEVKILYNICDIVVFPSLYEPFGIVALEAMSAGKVVVASDTGGLSDVVIQDFNGLRVAPGDPTALQATIDHLLNHPQDRWRMGRNGLNTVYERFSWKSIAKQTIRLYRQILEEYDQGSWKPKPKQIS